MPPVRAPRLAARGRPGVQFGAGLAKSPGARVTPRFPQSVSVCAVFSSRSRRRSTLPMLVLGSGSVRNSTILGTL